MAEDWDLHAVVRSCKSAQNTTIKPSTPSSSTTLPNKEDSLACLSELKFEEENDGLPYSFPNFEEPKNNDFQKLQQFYEPFLPNPTTTIPTSNTSLIPNSLSVSEIGGSSATHHVQYSQQQPNIANHFPTPNGSYIPGFGSEHAEQGPKLQTQVQNQRIQRLQRPQATMNSQPQRSRKRKNLQKKVMCEVAQENLSSDMWAWRKYGQKPIKGSPYPRNYYRCSSSKGCTARKQVERNSKNPSMFIVTYSGDHTHPRPTHRNSLAGSTRSKYSTPSLNPTQNKDPNTESPKLGNAYRLYPTTSLTVQTNHEEETKKEVEKENEEMGADEEDFEVNEDEEEEEEDDEEDYDEDDILIPNMGVTEDIFMGFQELGCASPSPSGDGGKKRS